jgi:hypothetical protein
VNILLYGRLALTYHSSHPPNMARTDSVGEVTEANLQRHRSEFLQGNGPGLSGLRRMQDRFPAGFRLNQQSQDLLYLGGELLRFTKVGLP